LFIEKGRPMVKKKLALLIHSLDALLSENGIKGGANRVNFELLNQLLKRNDVELTLITQKGYHLDYKGVHSRFFFEGSIYTERESVLAQINTYMKAHPELTLLCSDVLIPFGNVLLQSHSLPHRRTGDWWAIRGLSRFLNQANIQRQINNLLGHEEPSIKRTFFTVSQQIKDDYVQHFHLPAQHVHVVYPGVTMQHPSQIPPYRKPPVLGMVNSRSLNKGGLLFLSAVGLLKAMGYNFQVVMIYPQQKKDWLAQLLLWLFQLKRCVSVLPFQSDMTPFYSQIDALILPSLNEAFGLVVLEGMAQGVVPLVSSSAGVAELIHSGKNGVCFNRKRSAFWPVFNGIKDFLDLQASEVSRLKAAALETSLTFTWKRFTEEILQTLFAEASPPDVETQTVSTTLEVPESEWPFSC
jgi:glycosyltransferase involved in cell wall biosynthesis